MFKIIFIDFEYNIMMTYRDTTFDILILISCKLFEIVQNTFEMGVATNKRNSNSNILLFIDLVSIV